MLRCFLLVSLSVAVINAAATGFCGLPNGVEVCQDTKTIVRPSDNAAPKLPPQTVISKILGASCGYPIKDACSCSRSYVAPAIVPAPKCSKTGGSSGTSTITNSGSQNVCISQTQTVYTGGQQQGQSKNCGCGQISAADFVSIMQAQQAQKQCNPNEGRLQFGFETVPVESTVENDKICEDDITQLKGTVLEMRPVQRCASVLTLDEEAINSLPTQEELLLAEELAKEQQEGVVVKTLSYSDIGYAAAKKKDCQFASQQAELVIEQPCDSPAPVNCADGFVSGGVVIKKSRNGGINTACQQNGGCGAGNVLVPGSYSIKGSSSSCSSCQQSNVLYNLQG